MIKTQNCPNCEKQTAKIWRLRQSLWGAINMAELYAEGTGLNFKKIIAEARETLREGVSDYFHKLALSESFERVAKVAEERAAFNEQMALRAALSAIKGDKS